MLKLGFPVRDRPNDGERAPRAWRGPGSPLPRIISLSLPHTAANLACTHISPRTPRRLVDGPVPSSSSPPPPPSTPPTARAHQARLAQASASCASTHHPPPLAGGAVGRRLRLHRLLPAVRGAAAAHHADAVRHLAGLVRASTHPTPVLACVHRPPAPHPCRCPLRPCYPLLPPPTPSCPSHSRLTPSRCTCAGLAWHRSMA